MIIKTLVLFALLTPMSVFAGRGGRGGGGGGDYYGGGYYGRNHGPVHLNRHDRNHSTWGANSRFNQALDKHFQMHGPGMRIPGMAYPDPYYRGARGVPARSLMQDGGYGGGGFDGGFDGGW